ncbi:hypothetical protein Tco_0503602 [Tanacetum coccineum]
MHTARGDSLLGTMRFVSRHEDTQVYGALLPKAMTNQAMLDSDSYKTYYAIATGAKPPKPKKTQKKSDSAISTEETLSKKKPAKAKKDVPSTKKPDTKPKQTKKKAPVKADRGKGVPNEQQRKISSTDEGIGTKPGVPDVPKYDSESEKESWGDSRDEDYDDEDDTEDESDNDCNDDDGDNETMMIDSDDQKD